jgi:hypothetical protein
MCNPRRVTVQLTRTISQAWDEVVSRTVQAQGTVSAEARQRLGRSIPPAALQTLEAAFAASAEWQRTATGYRHNVTGGHVEYNPATQELEIVASARAQFAVEGVGVASASGTVSRQVTAQGQGTANWGEAGGLEQQRAQADAQTRLDQQAAAVDLRPEVEQARRQAAARAGQEADRRAAADAQERRHRQELSEQQRLDRQVQQDLRTVGQAGVLAFTRVLHRAYTQAILAWARQHQAQNIEVREDGDTIDIEFLVRA